MFFGGTVFFFFFFVGGWAFWGFWLLGGLFWALSPFFDGRAEADASQQTPNRDLQARSWLCRKDRRVHARPGLSSLEFRV